MNVNAHQTRLELAVRAWLASDNRPLEPDWLAKRRATAREYFVRNGIPTQREEAFRFLPLSSITKQDFRLSEPVQEAALQAPAWACSATIGFLNGHPVGAIGNLPTGLRIRRISDVLRTTPAELEPYLGSLVQPIHGFAAIGLSLFSDGWFVRVAPGAHVELPLDVVLQQSAGGWRIPRLVMVLDAGSHLSVTERRVASESSAVELTTGVFEFHVESGGHLDHIRLSDRGPAEAELTTTGVRVATDAHYHAWTVTSRGMLTRFDTRVSLTGRGARADLDGLYVARGNDIVDHHTHVEHACDSTTVQESYKGIVDDQAQAVFDGQIVVKPGAMGTNAQQFNRNLLMSDKAIVHTKPQLEIDADDVVCSHGATVGKLDEQQLFYLRSRGVSGGVAKQILTTAFAAELIDRCPVSEVTKHVAGYVATPYTDAIE
jgi:Fe-S cluster assembly protein SufD